MWATMGGMSDGLTTDISGGVNTLGYNKGYAGSVEAGGGQTNIGNYAWYYTNSISNSTTSSVGTKLANELEIYDLSGNVWEWCWDRYASSYPSTAQTNYLGAASGTYRVRRSGGWNGSATSCTVAGRNYGNPFGLGNAVGFRVVRS